MYPVPFMRTTCTIFYFVLICQVSARLLLITFETRARGRLINRTSVIHSRSESVIQIWMPPPTGPVLEIRNQFFCSRSSGLLYVAFSASVTLGTDSIRRYFCTGGFRLILEGKATNDRTPSS